MSYIDVLTLTVFLDIIKRERRLEMASFLLHSYQDENVPGGVSLLVLQLGTVSCTELKTFVISKIYSEACIFNFFHRNTWMKCTTICQEWAQVTIAL